MPTSFTPPSYSIQDEFTADRAAGAVNGTAAEPGPGTRLAVDTESKLVIRTPYTFFAIGDSKSTYQFGLWLPLTSDATLSLVECPETGALSGSTLASYLSGMAATLAARYDEPDFVFANWGANEFPSMPVEATWKANYLIAIDTVRAKWPNCWIYIVKPWRLNYNTEANTLAGWIDYIVTQRTNVYVGHDERIWFKSNNNGATNSDDGIHYNAVGAPLCAAQWRTIVGASGKTPIGTPSLHLWAAKASPADGDPGLWYSSVARQTGLVLAATVIAGDHAKIATVGFDTDQSGALGGHALSINTLAGVGTLYPQDNGVQGPAIATWIRGTRYQIRLVMGIVGALYFIKGGTFLNWTLLYPSATGNAVTLYEAATILSSPLLVERMAALATPYLPTLLLSDGFSTGAASDGAGVGIGQGGNGIAWVGGTWSIAGGKLLNTPNLGTDVNTNPELTTNTTGWIVSSASVLTRRDFSSSPNIAPTGGVNNFGLEVASGGSANSAARQFFSYAVGTWFQARARAYSPSSNTATLVAQVWNQSGAPVVQTINSAEDIWETLYATGRVTTNWDIRLRANSATAGDVAYYDAISMAPLTLSELLRTAALSTADVVIETTISDFIRGTVAGIAFNFDSDTNPQNGVIAYIEGTNIRIEKLVAGTWTAVANAARTFVANDRLIGWKSGTNYRIYYHETLLLNATISDAGIVSNTRHGVFSSNPGNLFEAINVYVTGSNNEYLAFGNIGILVSDGVLAPTGALVKQTLKIFSGTLALTGALIKQAIKLFSGALSLSGATLKQVTKIFDRVLLPEGELIKKTTKIFNGSLTPTGSFLSSVFALIRRIVSFLTPDRDSFTLEAGVITQTKRDFTIYARNSLTIEGQVMNYEGDGTRISQAALRWVLYYGNHEPVIEKIIGNGIRVINESTGRFEIDILAAETDLEAGLYLHECRVTDLAGNAVTVFIGRVTIKEDKL